MTDLGPEWVLDEDGVPSRQAARLVIFDPEGNVLLIRGHDTHDVEHAWWFTVGGGLEPGESPVLGAIREAFEETGFVFDPHLVEGPILHRSAEFRFRNVIARQEELFFMARINQVRPSLSSQQLTALELETLDEFRWFSPQELVEIAQVDTVYPISLPNHVAAWSRGWDGSMVELGERDTEWVRDPDPK